MKSSSKKHSPIYKLKVRYESEAGKWDDQEIEGKFTQWFNLHGYIQKKELRHWLANNIEVVGKADPESRRVAEKTYQGLVDDYVAMAAVTGVDIQSGEAKKTKPKKKT